MKYTPVRRFYAIVGFVVMLSVVAYLFGTVLGYMSVEPY